MGKIMLDLALSEIGTKEFVGKEDNPKVLKFSKETGLDWVKSEETSWCAIFIYWCVMKSSNAAIELDRPSKSRAATARAWLQCGLPVEIGKQRLGDIAIFWRESPESWKGHIGIYINDVPGKAGFVNILGGNQGDSVCIKEFSLDRLLGFRRL